MAGKAVKNKTRGKKEAKVRQDYNSLEPCKIDIGELNLTVLTYGIIESTEVRYIRVNEEKVDISNNWVGLILLMLSLVVENHPDDYEKLLMKNKVTNNNFNVSNMYGIYKFNKDTQLKVYKLFDKDIYVEALFNNENIFSAIIGLAKTCGYSLDEFYIGIRSQRYKEKLVDFDILDDNESIIGISDIALAEKAGWLMSEILILEERFKITDLNLILWVFCNGLVAKFGEDILCKMPRGKYVGISKTTERNDVSYRQILGSEKYLYTDSKNEKTIKYIEKCIEKLELPKDSIKFKFKRRLKHV